MIALFLIVCFSFSVFAAGMGFIDVQKVFMNYKEAKKMQEDFAKKEEAYKNKVEQKQIELDKVKNDQEKFKNLKKKITDELEGERDDLIELNQKLTTQLKEKILVAVKDVARSYALDTVVDKQVILYGGVDVTDWVIENLNKKK
jgi:Skp family chaperone for outer membrane proteins